jgi:hypothetical protein
VPLPALEKPLTNVRRKVNAFRARIEGELVESTGRVSPWQAKRIRTVCTCLREYARAARRMRLAEDGQGTPLTHAEWLAYSKHLMDAETRADKALDSLGLDRPETKSWYDQWIENAQREDRRRLEERLAAPPAAAAAPPAADPGSGQPTRPPRRRSRASDAAKQCDGHSGNRPDGGNGSRRRHGSNLTARTQQGLKPMICRDEVSRLLIETMNLRRKLTDYLHQCGIVRVTWPDLEGLLPDDDDMHEMECLIVACDQRISDLKDVLNGSSPLSAQVAAKPVISACK